jgi:hypothetical protein
MLLEEALPILENLIRRGTVHQDYERVTELATLYKRLIAGDEPEELLKQFVKREDDVMFKQRADITQLITPSLASSITKPFYKVARNDKVKKKLDIKEDVRRETVENMLDLFWGNDPDQNGLDTWLQTRFTELSFYDPNAWIVIEFDPFDPAQSFAQPRPFEVGAAEAANWDDTNGILKWLHVRQEVDVITKRTVTTDANGQESERLWTKKGHNHTMYTDQNAILYKEIDEKYMRERGITPEADEVLVRIGDRSYLRTVTNPLIGFVPAFRIGYARDGMTEGRTYVNPLHEAVPYFMKSVKATSEMDLTMALHAFPQKIQYVQKCPGSRIGNQYIACSSGKTPAGADCGTCNGKGYKIASSAQDAILLPMPEDKEAELSLSNIVHYVAPEVTLLDFQLKYGNEIELHAHRAVFNSTVFIETQIAKTATEKDLDMDSASDTLVPFAKKFSWVWKFVARTAIVLADVPNNDRQEVIHAFPADLKLKTTTFLVNELKTLNDSGAPPFMKEALNGDLASLIYVGDDLMQLKYKVKQSFYPFTGKTDEEIALLMESPYVPKAQKVLYANFEPIFALIEEEDPLFWYLEKFGEQKAKVDAKVDEWKKRTDEEAPPEPTFEENPSPQGSTKAKPEKAGLPTGGNNPNEE